MDNIETIKTLIIMRGCPGSGKSTRAKQLAQQYNAVILATDDFFMINDEYKFTLNKLNKAHMWNRNRTIDALSNGHNVVIDNTNMSLREINPYIYLAHEYGYSVKLAESRTDWRYNVEECFTRNTHCVPYNTILNMLNRFISSKDVIFRIKQILPDLDICIV